MQFQTRKVLNIGHLMLHVQDFSDLFLLESYFGYASSNTASSHAVFDSYINILFQSLPLSHTSF